MKKVLICHYFMLQGCWLEEWRSYTASICLGSHLRVMITTGPLPAVCYLTRKANGLGQ